MINNVTDQWEDRLGEALLAYRTSVSTTTGFTPFFLLYGRRSRMPLARVLKLSYEEAFGNRLHDLTEALRIARIKTEASRKYNRERLMKRANLGEVKPEDSVVIKANDRLTFTSRWDPHWEVTRVRGPVVWLRQQQTGKTKVLNKEKVRVVDPSILWDECNPRPTRYRPLVDNVV